jgi:CheY-like chemotaxis protein
MHHRNEDRTRSLVIERVLGSEYDVFLVPSMEAALDRVAAGEPFDLLLCELITPGLSGMEFHDRVGLSAPEQVERIVFVTAGPASEGTKVFLEQPNIHWIEKPLTSLAAFRVAVRGAPPAAVQGR